MWWFLFVALIAAFKAVSDTLADHFTISIFKNLNAAFWDKETASRTAPFFRWKFIKTRYRVDAWHLSNSAWICLALALPFVHEETFHPLLEYPTAGALFILVFNLFYNKLLIKK